MKQIVQSYDDGKLRLEEVPAPLCRSGGVLVRTAYSLVSIGTERMKVSQARMSLLAKARARPDKVRQVVQSARQVGLVETYRKARERLAALSPLGYSLAGVVEQVGAGLDEFQVRDRVACAGEGIACHAEFVFVPRNLCVRVPEGVDLKDAAFATVGAIAMQGVRQAGATLGDSVVVVGLGLVGLLAVQLLKAAGCRVVGVDVDPYKVALAEQCGADLALRRDDAALEESVRHFTGGRGADAAYIAASTASSDPLDLAGRLLRDRGRVVIVGMVKLEADWRVYYQKELAVVMSRSYGPGRYDRNYEHKGINYPIGYVPWTQRRNLEEFVRLLTTGHVQPARLTPKVVKLEDAPQAYARLNGHAGRTPIAILFEYPPTATSVRRVVLPHLPAHSRASSEQVGIGLIGAGNFATGTLIPALKRLPVVRRRAICSAGGLSARSAGERHGFELCASDYRELLEDREIQAVIIATRHDTHARYVVEALHAGKHVFVEKPLALTHEELDEVLTAQAESQQIVMVGFNRRFSPLSVALREFFAGRAGPIEVVCRVNAGALKADSWYLDADEGGWRIVSEGCHFVDLIQFLCGSPPVRVFAEMIGGDVPGGQNDNCVVTLKLRDGSLGTLIYVANGDPCFEKERIEVFGQQRVGVIENWRLARLHAGGRSRKVHPNGSGKGHAAEIQAFIEAVRNGSASPLPLAEAVACTRATFAAVESLASGMPALCAPNGSTHDESPRG